MRSWEGRFLVYVRICMEGFKGSKGRGESLRILNHTVEYLLHGSTVCVADFGINESGAGLSEDNTFDCFRVLSC